MKKLSILLSILASVIAFPTFAQDVAQVELTQQQQAVYQQLQTQSSNLSVSWNEPQYCSGLAERIWRWIGLTDQTGVVT